MYTQHFGLDRLPFHPLSDPHVIYPSNELREAACHFRFSRDNRESFFLLTGEVGAGKTTAVRAFLAELPPETPVAVMTHSTLGPRDFLLEVAARLRVAAPASAPRKKRSSKRKLLHRLETALVRYAREGRRAVLVIDEAHLLSDPVLEEVRLLSNLRDDGHPVLQVCLVGQPEILDRLRAPRMRPLRQRITSRYAMKPLSEPESREYMTERLRFAGSVRPNELFEPAAVRSIHRMSGGIPREINVLAGQSLLNAYVDHAPAVRKKHVGSVRKDYGFEGVRLPWFQRLKAQGLRADPNESQPVSRPVSPVGPRPRLRPSPPHRVAREAGSSRPARLAWWPLLLRRAKALRLPSIRLPRIPVPSIPTPRISMSASPTAWMDRGATRSALVFVASLALLFAGTMLMLRSDVVRAPAPPPPVPISPPVSTWASPIPLVSTVPAGPPPVKVELRSEEEVKAKPAVARPRAPEPRSLADRYPSTLKVMSDSPGTVWLGNQRLGTAPGTFTAIRPGRYTLRLEIADGSTLQKDVIVTPGSTTFVRAGSLDPVSNAVKPTATAAGDP